VSTLDSGRASLTSLSATPSTTTQVAPSLRVLFALLQPAKPQFRPASMAFHRPAGVDKHRHLLLGEVVASQVVVASQGSAWDRSRSSSYASSMKLTYTTATSMLPTATKTAPSLRSFFALLYQPALPLFLQPSSACHRTANEDPYRQLVVWDVAWGLWGLAASQGSA
jgi:hypothetical protein